MFVRRLGGIPSGYCIVKIKKIFHDFLTIYGKARLYLKRSFETVNLITPTSV